jgi:hypothetical protein
LGLAGNGHCVFMGDFTNANCPQFIDEDDFIKKWETETKEEKGNESSKSL